jgi:hypothetical protein
MNSKILEPKLSEGFARLGYKSQHGLQRLPEWVRFYLELGHALATFESNKNRYVIALSVPTRSLVAPFIGSGLSCANIFLQSIIDHEHAEFIFSLPEGTAVKYFDKERVRKAIVQNIMIYEGEERLGLLVEEDGNKTIFIAAKDTYKIDVADKEISRLPKHQTGRAVHPPSHLLTRLLSEKADEYIIQTRIDGVVVGSLFGLSLESQLELSFQVTSKEWHDGSLRDLFRVKGEVPANIGYRYLVQSAIRNELTIAHAGLLSHAAVIFDGALGFLKWRETFVNQNWVVILDRTEPNFLNACAAVNAEYASRSESKIHFLYRTKINSG